MTVKLRSGQRAGGDRRLALAHRLVDEAGVSAIAFHPRSAAVHHKGTPDYDLAAQLVATLGAPVILTGGLHTPEAIRAAYEHTGAAAVMLARGALGNPWLFEEVLGLRAAPPAPEEILDELDWVMDRAVEHLGADRAGRYLRKFYPWYARPSAGPARRSRRPSSRPHSVVDARAVAEQAASRRGSGLNRRYTAPLRPALPAGPDSPPTAGFFVQVELPEPTRANPCPRTSSSPPKASRSCKSELEELQTVKRREVAERIKEAREFGDISENSEYDDAKNDQMMLEQKIAQIEERLRSAQVIEVGELVHRRRARRRDRQRQGR